MALRGLGEQKVNASEFKAYDGKHDAEIHLISRV